MNKQLLSNVYECVIGSNSDIRTKLDEFIVSHGWDHVYISGAIGSITEAVLSAPLEATLPPVVGTTTYKGVAELSSFVGYAYKREIAPKEELMLDPCTDSPLYVHIHASFGIAGGHAYAGGFRGGKTFRAMNVFIVPLS